MHQEEFYKQSTLPGQNVVQKESLPQQIGPYKIQSLLTRGGMSLLYLGKHPETNKLLVIKVLSPQFVKNEEMIQQFLKEAQIIGLTDHPNIIKLYGQGKWEGGLYIAMEFIQGISLRQFIVQHSLSLRRSLDIVLQVAYALLHLHTHGVIHRDLKPENILITENGQIKVIDFGIAQLTQDIQSGPSQPHRLIGTPNYMSPEQKADPKKVSFASDIFSIGMIAYELVLGKLSFGNVQFSLLPQNLRKIIKNALADDLNERYQDIVDFITDVSAYLKSNAIQKERSGEDELKEVLEMLSRSQKTLLPQDLPHLPQLELGLAKPQSSQFLGTYYDFITLPNRSMIILIAEADSIAIDATIYIAFLKGMIRMSLHEYHVAARAFDPITFVQTLNDKITEDQLPAKFRLNILYLDEGNEEFTFVSTGFDSIWHVSHDSSVPRLIESDNPMLGEKRSVEFYSAKDTWQDGDCLIMHTFVDNTTQEQNRKQLIDSAKTAITNSQDMSMTPRANHIFKTLSNAAPVKIEKNQKLVICMQRID